MSDTELSEDSKTRIDYFLQSLAGAPLKELTQGFNLDYVLNLSENERVYFILKVISLMR